MDIIDIRKTFESKNCGNKGVSLPDQPTEDSIATCPSCGMEVGRWSAVQKAVKDEVRERLMKAAKEAVKDWNSIRFE